MQASYIFTAVSKGGVESGLVHGLLDQAAHDLHHTPGDICNKRRNLLVAKARHPRPCRKSNLVWYRRLCT